MGRTGTCEGRYVARPHVGVPEREPLKQKRRGGCRRRGDPPLPCIPGPEMGRTRSQKLSGPERSQLGHRAPARGGVSRPPWEPAPGRSHTSVPAPAAPAP
ncbi:hypothetical protein AAFF_G00184800 [Aldrovandia affinis]|uniref:Uncharacterized protein n=1 Tax=Aldrovandia affinis TaxID=143900 RepID=A0AAD7W610_9TELE|nr:hypothetical protein AAFF_G00184800 [Aldrovandia affinis]